MKVVVYDQDEISEMKKLFNSRAIISIGIYKYIISEVRNTPDTYGREYTLDRLYLNN